MYELDAMQEWWADPEAVVIEARQTKQIIEWLGQQSPDTWHQVAMNWNYDYGDEVLSWILDQDNCDKGTAAHIFLVEGCGHWLWEAFSDQLNVQDTAHICHTVLRNWGRYKTADLKHEYEIPEKILKLVREKGGEGIFENSPLEDIINFEGNRQAVSKYGSEDGKIVIAFDFWMKSKGIELSQK